MHKIQNKIVFFILLASLSTSLIANSTVKSPTNIKRFGVDELILKSTQHYDATNILINPFTDVELSAAVTSPSGKTITVKGFYDGNGNGGLTGNVFKIRFGPDEFGIWEWQTNSNIPEFDNIRGEFEVTETITGRFSKGPIGISPTSQHHFSHRNGERIFLLGKFLDRDAPEPLKYSHTFFSESLDEAHRKDMFFRHVRLGANKINLYIANVGDYNGMATTPWITKPWWLDFKTRFDLKKWHSYEKWTKRMLDQGMVAHFWVLADDSDFGDMWMSQIESIMSYTMARLSAYSNTMFTTTLEWQEAFSKPKINRIGEFIQEQNPWDRLISAHELEVVKKNNPQQLFILRDEEWLDFLDLQSGFVEEDSIYATAVKNRTIAPKPMLLEEFSFGHMTDEERIKTWAAVMSNPAGIGTGTGIKAIGEFLATINLEQMQPAPRIIAYGKAYALENEQGEIIVYSASPKDIRLNLHPEKIYNLHWFDPRKGEWAKVDTLFNTHTNLIPPTAGDWVLLIKPKDMPSNSAYPLHLSK